MRSNPEVPSAELVMSAIDRAVRQSVRPVTDVSASFIAEHLSLNRRSGLWRQALRLLRELEAVGEVEQGRRLGVTVWALTDAGRERLARVVRHGQGPLLPESPQLRRWRESRRLAAQDADRFRAELVAALEDGLQLLNEAATSSDAWLALSSRLARAPPSPAPWSSPAAGRRARSPPTSRHPAPAKAPTGTSPARTSAPKAATPTASN